MTEQEQREYLAELGRMSNRDLMVRVRWLLDRLGLVSHGTCAKFGTPVGDGTAVLPPGGAARKDDREEDHPQKSHQHFERRLRGCRDRADIELVALAMRRALDAWAKTPIHNAPEPARGSAMWKRWIASLDKPASSVAREYQISVRTIRYYRSEYKDAA